MDPDTIRDAGEAAGDVKPSFDLADTANGIDSTRGHVAAVSGSTSTSASTGASNTVQNARPRNRRKKNDQDDDPSKRRCVSTACIACRKRKSKCDGNLPACAACSQVYGTDCIYNINSDHRRKGVYKNDVDNLKTRDSTLQTLIQAILNYAEDDIPPLIKEIRSCENLDAVAERIIKRENGTAESADHDDGEAASIDLRKSTSTFESHLYGKMGDLRLDEGSVRYIGGTSNLIHLGQDEDTVSNGEDYLQQESPVTSWTTVTDDAELVLHLLNMYFTWHYSFFTTLSKQLFYRDFALGRPPPTARRKTHYCTPLLVNAMLALGCHFTAHAGAREDPEDSATAGDHFFREAKRLIMENDEHEKPHLTTVQALALMSVREAGCAREARGWVYSGMSFRMACDMGLNIDSGQLTSNRYVSGDENEDDVRRVTFWGCYMFDKCWSNYMGRLPQLPTSLVSVARYEVFPEEDSAQWRPYTDSGFTQAHAQPARTRAVALQIMKLCEISNDLMMYFYHPTDMEKSKGRSAELRKLSDIHTRLEAWRRDLPQEFEPKEGCLSAVLVMHMFFQLLFIHLFRPFLKYTQATSPLPSTVSPRKLCTQAATMISKLMRLYKRSHGLRQIPNIAVYITHSACTIHLLNLPDKNARRDIVHGVKHLEEIAQGWLCARRTLAILSVLARKWKLDLPEEAASVLARTDAKFDSFAVEGQSPAGSRRSPTSMPDPGTQIPQQAQHQTVTMPSGNAYLDHLPPGMLNPQNNAANPNKSLQSGTPSQNRPRTDSQGMQTQHRYPSTSSVPVTSFSNSMRHETNSSDMFGGVEQLIRDSSEWAFRDQAQLANGFENWTAMELDPHAWTQHHQMPVATTGPISIPPSMATVAAPMQPQQYHHQGASGPLSASSSVDLSSMTNTMDSVTMANWLNSMATHNGMATSYNEDEWYQ